MRRVIVDTDPGVDDALALMLAFSSPELAVEAVTTVDGNVSLERAHGNALKVLEFLGVEGVPVGRGAARPLLREAEHAEDIHGETGLGAAELPESASKLPERSAIGLILEKAEARGRDLTLVALGPLTNIATALLVDPGLAGRVAGLVSMGGAFHLTPHGHGNVTPVAEFNIWHDPEAAKVVFESEMPITSVGLDVTAGPSCRLSRAHLDEIERLGTARARLVADLGRGLVERFGGLSLHDPVAVAVAADPSLARTERYNVEVEVRGELTRGQTFVDRRGRTLLRGGEPNVDVCVSVDGRRFRNMFMERVVGRRRRG